MVERTVNCDKVRVDVFRLIYLYLGKHEFFLAISLLTEKTRLPLPAERLSCLYIQWFACMDTICQVGLWENVSYTDMSCVSRGKKGSETFFKLILSEN